MKKSAYLVDVNWIPEVTTRQLALILLLILSCLPMALYAEEHQAEENLLKAVFIYNFAKFTRWPDDMWDERGPSLTICSIGHDKLSDALERLNGRMLRDNPVNIDQRESLTHLDTCHVLYLANSIEHEAIEITHTLRSKPILTISEIPDFAESGGMIELFHNDGRIHFKVNLHTTREAGLDLSSRLLKLAIIVDQ
jgi:hypothetical protein